MWPLLEVAHAIGAEAEWPAVERYRSLLGTRCPVDFVVAEPRARGRRRAQRRSEDPSYDAIICEQRVVPSRPRSWHDLFNAMVWAAFPRTKLALHRRQHLAQRARAGIEAGRRTREQDALALLDEGGVALLCDSAVEPEASAALAQRDATRVSDLVARGVALGVVYGHAVYEHRACGGPPVRAMIHLVEVERIPGARGTCVELADRALAGALADPGSFTRPERLRSLPAEPAVLGPP